MNQLKRSIKQHKDLLTDLQYKQKIVKVKINEQKEREADAEIKDFLKTRDVED